MQYVLFIFLYAVGPIKGEKTQLEFGRTRSRRASAMRWSPPKSQVGKAPESSSTTTSSATSSTSLANWWVRLSDFCHKSRYLSEFFNPKNTIFETLKCVRGKFFLRRTYQMFLVVEDTLKETERIELPVEISLLFKIFEQWAARFHSHSDSYICFSLICFST